MKLKNVGYGQHGRLCDYRSGNIVIPSGGVADVPDEHAQHLLRMFPLKFVEVGEAAPVPEIDAAPVAVLPVDDDRPRRGKRR